MDSSLTPDYRTDISGGFRKGLHGKDEFPNVSLQFNDLLDKAPVGVCTINASDFTVLQANNKYLEIVDKTPAEFIGFPLFDTLPTVKEVALPLFLKVIKSRQPFVGNEIAVPINRFGRIETAYFNFTYQPYIDGDMVTAIIVVANEVTELVLSRAMVSQSEKEFRNVVKYSPIAMAVFKGPSMIIEMVNENMRTHVFRKPEEKMVGRPLTEVFPELLDQQFPALLKKVYETGIAHREKEALAYLTGDDGTKAFYFDYEYAALFNADRNVIGIMVTAYDVSEKVIARKQIEEAEEMFRLATEHSHVSTWDVNLITNEIHHSANLAEIFGHPPGTKIPRVALQAQIIAEDRDAMNAAVESSMKTGQYHYEARINRADGELRWISVNGKLIKDSSGKYTRMLGTITDITDTKNGEIQASRLAAIVESSGDAIISCDRDGIILTWNSAAERIYGFTSSEMCGKTITEIVPENKLEEENSIFLKVMRGNVVEHFETRRCHKSGTLLDISLSVSPIRNTRGEVIGVSKIGRNITGQKESERVLAESEAKLQIALEASGLGTWELNLQTNETYCSNKYLEIIGYPPDTKFSQEQLYRMMHPDDLQIRESARIKAMETGHLAYQCRIIDPRGKIKWLDINGRVFFDEKKAPLKILGTVRDITDELIYKQKIEESENRLRIAALSGDMGIWDWNMDSGVLNLDLVAMRLYEIEQETEISFDLLMSKVHPDDLESVRDSYTRSLDPVKQSSLDIEYRILTSEGIRWLRSKGRAFFEKGKAYRYSGTVLDITSKRAALEALVASERQFRLLADSLPQFIWIADENGQASYFNRAFTTYTGKNEKELAGTDWKTIIHPDDVKTNELLWNRAIETGNDFTIQHRMLNHHGEFRWQHSRAIARKDEDGNVTGWIGTSTDVHDQKTFAEELEKKVAERTAQLEQTVNELKKTNEDLEQFAYVSSHDLQEPLRKIQTFSGLLRDRMKHESEQYQLYFDKINISAKRMSELISDLLSYSRVSKKGSEFVQVDLNEIMRKIESDFELLIKEKSAVISCEKLPVIKGIPIQLNQLLFNLLGNALKFNNKPKALISITCKELPPAERQMTPGLPSPNPYYKLTISDNGIGFSNEYKERIFTIFQRLNDGGKFEGTGIGLAICRKIAENHNGRIEASGVEGEGAEFSVYLPKS